MDANFRSFREWFVSNEASDSLFWVGPLLNDRSNGIVALAHQLKNRMATSRAVVSPSLWNYWKSFFGAVSNVERQVQYGDSSSVLNLFQTMRRDMGDITTYYKSSPDFANGNEAKQILSDLDSAVAQLMPSQNTTTPAARQSARIARPIRKVA